MQVLPYTLNVHINVCTGRKHVIVSRTWRVNTQTIQIDIVASTIPTDTILDTIEK